jgi:DNA mismatch endonuclease (patch repair protein)
MPAAFIAESTRARPGYPFPSSAGVRRRMQRQASRDTQIERRLRSSLHRQGLRFRVHLRPIAGARRTADIVFTRARVAVYLDGCFWHGCQEHLMWPRANSDYWREKILGNRRRDADTDSRLREAGWKVVRVWEHEDLATAAERIMAVVRTP